MKIFDVDEFQAFDWLAEYESLCSQISPSQNYKDLLLNQYAIVPISWLEQAEKVEALNIAHFGENQLVGIRCENKSEQMLIDFKFRLFQMHAAFVQYFLNIVMKHLEKRFVKETSVIKFDHIRQLIAEIISDLEMSKMMRGVEQGTEQLNVGHDCLLDAALKLMKLPGGRAFLKGSVLELVWILRAFNNVYYVS